jgi:hypothetical protein
VVSGPFAAFFFGAGPAVGRHVLVRGEDHEVIGVVEDAPIVRLHEPRDDNAPAVDSVRARRSERKRGLSVRI